MKKQLSPIHPSQTSDRLQAILGDSVLEKSSCHIQIIITHAFIVQKIQSSTHTQVPMKKYKSLPLKSTAPESKRTQTLWLFRLLALNTGFLCYQSQIHCQRNKHIQHPFLNEQLQLFLYKYKLPWEILIFYNNRAIVYFYLMYIFVATLQLFNAFYQCCPVSIISIPQYEDSRAGLWFTHSSCEHIHLQRKHTQYRHSEKKKKICKNNNWWLFHILLVSPKSLAFEPQRYLLQVSFGS